MHLHTFSTARTARYYSLGEPGPAIRHIWFCLHSHNESVAGFANQLRPLDTPERLLILPEGLSRFDQPDATLASSNPLATWFTSDVAEYDLPDVAQYLDALAEQIVAACPPGTPVTILGHGHGAVAACRWLANSTLHYERLVLYAAVFPPEINRQATLAGLPKRPVVVVATTADVYTPEAAGEGLLQDLHDAGLPAQLRHASDGSITLAALGASAETA